MVFVLYKMVFVLYKMVFVLYKMVFVLYKMVFVLYKMLATFYFTKQTCLSCISPWRQLQVMGVMTVSHMSLVTQTSTIHHTSNTIQGYKVCKLSLILHS
jgi:hypothetical protein